MKKSNILIPLLCLVGLSTVQSCKDKEVFDNNIFIASPKVETIINKANTVLEIRTLQSSIAKPESQNIDLKYSISPNLVDHYNTAYNAKASILPAEYYSLSTDKSSINVGAVASTPITVTFKDINKLDRDLLFVLPISVESSNLSILQSAKTTYYVVKGGALINVVVNLDKTSLHIDNWVKAAPLNGLKELTMEALIRVQKFDKMISTVMGIEGRFLIRLGDAGFPANQIQVATSAGNFPSANASKGLPVNQWVHVAVTYNSVAKTVKVYVDGKLQSLGSLNAGTVNLGVNGVDGFYIGRSYDDNRFLSGDVSECRIWNVERTADEIASNIYDVSPQSAGLVAYWKCNEGAGTDIKDNTSNLNHLSVKAGTQVNWIPVSLPAKN